MSMVLCVLAIITITAGALGLRKNEKDAAENIRTLTLLKQRTEDYVKYLSILEGKKTYSELKKDLDKRQEEHDKKASQHKTDLAEYTATKGGIISGKEQLQEGYKKLQEGQAQSEDMISMLYSTLNQARTAGETAGEEQAKAVVEQEALKASAAMLEFARSQGEERAYQDAYAAACSNAIIEVTEEEFNQELYDTDETYKAQIDAIRAQVPSDRSVYQDIIQAGGQTEYDQAASQIVAYALSTEEAQKGIQTAKEQGAAMAEKKFYEGIAEKYPEYSGLTVDELSDRIRNTINDGYAAIIYGNWQLEKTEAELPEKEDKINSEIEPLKKEAAELEKEWIEADVIKQNEKKLTSAKVLLSSNENIKKAVDNGVDLVEAANTEIARREASDTKDYRFRLFANIFAIAGGVFAFLGIPATFEKTKSRFLLIAPVVMFVLLTAAADYLSIELGRGQMYSCLCAAIIGLIQLIVIIPKKKIG